jgi:hypothetical protein
MIGYALNGAISGLAKGAPSMAVPKLQLRFPCDEIAYWESRFIEEQGDDGEIRDPAERSRSAGYFEKPDFLAICCWKSPRIISRCRENSDEFIRAVTKAALSTPCEEFRIYAPTLLRGVGWRVSSVLLHFAHPEPYPIIDFRALWSLNWDLDANRDDYDFEFWWTYVQFCRTAAAKCGVSMRALDRALWQYSKEKQKGS